MLLCVLLLLHTLSTVSAERTAVLPFRRPQRSSPAKDDDLVIGGFRPQYENNNNNPPSKQDLLQELESSPSSVFGRFQSPSSILRRFENCRCDAFRHHSSKDGREGQVSCTKLGNDWILAESQQVAVDCSTQDVLRAYLSGKLQTQWNQDKVLDCQITARRNKNRSAGKADEEGGPYYQQDLVLKSQRIIRSHTGIMRYSQKISIDQIGKDNYCVSVRLINDGRNTAKKPFEALCVHVNLEQVGRNVHIYAAGVMKVNRQVVPNLVVFDASGIAGNMAGKGTLWLAAYFRERQQSRVIGQFSPNESTRLNSGTLLPRGGSLVSDRAEAPESSRRFKPRRLGFGIPESWWPHRKVPVHSSNKHLLSL